MPVVATLPITLAPVELTIRTFALPLTPKFMVVVFTITLLLPLVIDSVVEVPLPDISKLPPSAFVMTTFGPSAVIVLEPK